MPHTDMTTPQEPENVNADFNSAFISALGELSNVEKNSLNPHFRSRYASLDAILDLVRPILSKHGMGISQEPIFEDGKAGVLTRIIHKSGCRESMLLLPVKDQTAQGVGSAITYARRYSVSAVLNIAADEDDDGQEATKPTPFPQKSQAEPRNQQPRDAAQPQPQPQPQENLQSPPLEALAEKMWDYSIPDAHVIEFLLSKNVEGITRSTLLTDVPEKIIKGLIKKWDDVTAFKPAMK